MRASSARPPVSASPSTTAVRGLGCSASSRHVPGTSNPRLPSRFCAPRRALERDHDDRSARSSTRFDGACTIAKARTEPEPRVKLRSDAWLPCHEQLSGPRVSDWIRTSQRERPQFLVRKLEPSDDKPARGACPTLHSSRRLVDRANVVVDQTRGSSLAEHLDQQWRDHEGDDHGRSASGSRPDFSSQ